MEKDIELDIERLRECYAMAATSTDPSTQNGAMLVGLHPWETVLGRNGLPPGVRDMPERHQRPLKLHVYQHAEEACITLAARGGIITNGLTMYACWASCAACARLIVAAGVKKLVAHDAPFHHSRPDWAESIAAGDMMLEEAGVEVVRIARRLGCKIRFNGAVVEA